MSREIWTCMGKNESPGHFFVLPKVDFSCRENGSISHSLSLAKLSFLPFHESHDGSSLSYIESAC